VAASIRASEVVTSNGREKAPWRPSPSPWTIQGGKRHRPPRATIRTWTGSSLPSRNSSAIAGSVSRSFARRRAGAWCRCVGPSGRHEPTAGIGRWAKGPCARLAGSREHARPVRPLRPRAPARVAGRRNPPTRPCGQRDSCGARRTRAGRSSVKRDGGDAGRCSAGAYDVLLSATCPAGSGTCAGPSNCSKTCSTRPGSLCTSATRRSSPRAIATGTARR